MRHFWTKHDKTIFIQVFQNYKVIVNYLKVLIDSIQESCGCREILRERLIYHIEYSLAKAMVSGKYPLQPLAPPVRVRKMNEDGRLGMDDLGFSMYYHMPRLSNNLLRLRLVIKHANGEPRI